MEGSLSGEVAHDGISYRHPGTAIEPASIRRLTGVNIELLLEEGTGKKKP